MFFTTVARVDFSGLALHTRSILRVSKRVKKGCQSNDGRKRVTQSHSFCAATPRCGPAAPSHQMPCREGANCPAPYEMVIQTKTATIKQPSLQQLFNHLYRYFIAKSEQNGQSCAPFVEAPRVLLCHEVRFDDIQRLEHRAGDDPRARPSQEDGRGITPFARLRSWFAGHPSELEEEAGQCYARSTHKK